VSERASLYAALNDAGSAESVAMLLAQDDFYDITLGRVFAGVQALVKEHQPVDVPSVCAWLGARDWQAPDGGWYFFVRDLHIGDSGAAASYGEKYATIVATKARRRRILAGCHRFVNEGYFDVGNEQEWCDTVVSTFQDYAQPPERMDAQPVGDALREAFAEITAAAERGDVFTGVPTGYDRLDACMSGLHEGDLTIVAARPGMGKTSWVMNVAVNVASPREVIDGSRKTDVPGLGVCVFSLEMPRKQLVTRMACSEGRVDLGRLRQARLLAEDWRKLTESAAYLSSLPIWIDDTPALSVLELRAKVRSRQAKFNRPATETQPARKVGLVVIDYLQLMTGDGESREQEISYISRGLKNLAKSLKVPVVALSQLNRAVETRGKDKRPQMSDLRESGAIEQDADNIIFIYRDDYYNDVSELRGIAELIVAKQRNGPTGKVKVRFHAGCTRFDNLDPGDYPQDGDE
jgi:replicative DNA helicase